jgi:anaerobic glycerol-3-phosphate dehydrogenase B subunit
MDYDVIVIGSGIAGTLAAINAARNKKVAVIRKGYGASALSSGAFDIASKTGTRGRPLKGLSTLSVAITEILENEQNHPYSILSRTFTGDRFNEFIGMVKTVGSQFFDELKSVGLGYEGSWENLMIIPNLHGTFKVTSFCQPSMESGNLARLRGRKLLFVGFDKITSHSKTRAGFLSRLLSDYGFVSFKDISYTNINIHEHNIAYNENDLVSLASVMDTPEQARYILNVLKQSLAGIEYEHAFIPPIMGIAGYNDVYQMFVDVFGYTVSEFLSSSFSSAGLRLQYALDKLLAKHGVTIINGTVVCEQNNDKIKTLTIIKKDGNSSQISANSFVLATGKFISNGIKKDTTWKEAVFGLPLFIGSHVIREPFPMNYLTDDPFDEQILFSMGVKVDEYLRPVNEDGKVIYNNLFAAGSILSGYNYIYDRTGMGTAMMTGARAGILSAG